MGAGDRRTIASPRPEPGRPRASGARQKRSKAASDSSARSPGPASLTDSRARPPAPRTAIRTGGAPWTSALATRLSSARRSASSSPRTTTRAGASAVTSPPWADATVRARSSSATADGAAPASVGALEDEQLVDEPAQPLGVLAQVGQGLRVGTVAGQVSTFPRSAASGFRSSCEASATKRRSPSRARSSAASIPFSVSA